MLEIDGVLLNKDILKVKFACNLKECKGACCTLESEFGAPVTEMEIVEIEKNLVEIEKYLPLGSRQKIEKEGFFEAKSGELLIKSIENKDCVFVYYEGDVAKCAIEKAFRNGEINFPKPLSCHLFPIRVSNFGGDVLRYEKYKECTPALAFGEEKNVTLVEFLEEPLTRAYGKDWYGKLLSIKAGE